VSPFLGFGTHTKGHHESSCNDVQLELVEPTQEAYVNATIIMRPPRVAVLFQGGEHWSAWARLAISIAGRYWGGGGFILVPYSATGLVSPQIMSVVAAYDPDHVVTTPLTLLEYERTVPGAIPLLSNSRTLVDEDERRTYLEGLPEIRQRDAVAMRARSMVAEACTPLRDSYAPTDDDLSESVELLRPEPDQAGGWLTPAVREIGSSVFLAGSESWKHDAALCSAIRTGIIPAPLEQSSSGSRNEPDPSKLLQLALDRWNPERLRQLPEEMTVGERATDKEFRLWFEEPGGGLATMRDGWGSDGGAIVVGDTPEDFALAYAYERLLGFGVWISTQMLKDKSLAPTLRTLVSQAGQRIQGNGQRLSLSSASVGRDGLRSLIEVLHSDTLNTNPKAAAASGELARIRRLPDGVEVGVPDLRRGLSQLAVEDPFVVSMSVPVSMSQDGTVSMRAPLPTPIPTKPFKTRGFPRPYWYIEVDLDETAMPRGRGVPQDFVQYDLKRYANNAVRSSRGGLTFHSRAGGVIPAGSSLSSQLNKPLLKVPGMQPWVKAMARRGQMDAAPSLPGMHAQLIERRLGGRLALTSLVAGVFHPALRIFANTGTTSSRTDNSFPDQDGVVLQNEPYPRFEALKRAAPCLSDQDLRSWIDRLAEVDLIRRGFILDCSDCTRPSFVGIDQVGERFECTRCSAVNQLASARWRSSDNQPPWFYDLHASFRELITQNGDVSLFAANRLRRGSWQYADTGEIEFYHQGTRKRIAEIDLIAHVDGQVVLVEAKSNGQLGNGRRQALASARKKVAIAKAIRANKIVIATTASTLVASTMDVLREAAALEDASNLLFEELVALGPDRRDHELTFDI
jgi:Holliday junction resolvase-like predicted endonuclease